MKSTEWWKGTATHMWRAYFTLVRDGVDWDNLSQTNRKIYAVCNHIFLKRFVRTDQDILRTYFTSRWGDDIYTIEDYSAKNNIPTKVIWMVIKRANRIVMEEIGLLDRKDGGSDD